MSLILLRSFLFGFGSRLYLASHPLQTDHASRRR